MTTFVEVKSIKSFLEDTRKELLQDADLRSELKSKKVRSSLVKVLGREKTLVYKSSSGDEVGKYWTQLIKAEIQPRMTAFGVKRAVNERNILCHCDCPAFKWWGYSYIMTSRRAIYPTKDVTIYPKIRNPRLVGSVCKHLFSVLMQMEKDAQEIYKNLNKNN